ncbi:unnamed protein product [Thelazia callipaeda]|uniref:PHD-type domain-containing protein n=1 Tax=Thelazia callipaeda TaxID=103827 RepID=A0A0N5D3A9_THECL|nr:unnamed protein product [Thelazia callipaeda]
MMDESITDGEVSEALSVTEENSKQQFEEQAQEEKPDDQQSKECSVTSEKPVSKREDSTFRSLNPAEDYSLSCLAQSVIKTMDNIGFVMYQESVLDILIDLGRRYMEKLWYEAKILAEHAGRLFPIFEDANLTFNKLMFSVTDLHMFMKQVQFESAETKIPSYPVKLDTEDNIYGPVSERELKERPEHIPHYFPAIHPEWCDQIKAQSVESSPSNDQAQKTLKSRNIRRLCVPLMRMTKSKISFPDFTGLTAKELGFIRPIKLPSKKVIEEPSGISSSANIAAQLTDLSKNISRNKYKKWSVADSIGNSSYFQDQMTSNSLRGKENALNKTNPQRPSGMFGMPPSALVNCGNIGEKIKKKKKEKDRDKDSVKEKKMKHRDKEKEQDTIAHNKSFEFDESPPDKSVPSSCSTVFGSFDQITKASKQQSGSTLLLSKQSDLPENNQTHRHITDTKKDDLDKKSAILINFSYATSVSSGRSIASYTKKDDGGEFKNDKTVDSYVGDDCNDPRTSSQMIKDVKPQKLEYRSGKYVGELFIGDSKEPWKKEYDEEFCESEETANEDVDRTVTVDDTTKELENCKVDDVENECGSNTAKAEDCLASISPFSNDKNEDTKVDDVVATQDSKALKMVLSRQSGQKEFTAFSPSNGTNQTEKDIEPKFGDVDVASHGSGNLEKKKKHRKDKDRGKHHNKEHKGKDRKEYKGKDKKEKDKEKGKEKDYGKVGLPAGNLKRPPERIPVDVPAPKIPKLKIRFGSNSDGTSPAVMPVPSAQISEGKTVLPADENARRMHSSFKAENEMVPSSKPTAPKRLRKPSVMTKGELKALPKLSSKSKTSEIKEGRGLKEAGKSKEELETSLDTAKADAHSLQQINCLHRTVGKRMHMDEGRNEFPGCQAGNLVNNTSGSILKVGKEKKESGIPNTTSKCETHILQHITPSGAAVTGGRRIEKEVLKKDVERAKKKTTDVKMSGGTHRSAKVKDSFAKRAPSLVVCSDKDKLSKDRYSVKTKGWELDKDKKKGKEKEEQHRDQRGRGEKKKKSKSQLQKTYPEDKHQRKQDEKASEKAEGKKPSQREGQKEKGSERADKKVEEGEKRKDIGAVEKEKVGIAVGNDCGDSLLVKQMGRDKLLTPKRSAPDLTGPRKKRKMNSLDYLSDPELEGREKPICKKSRGNEKEVNHKEATKKSAERSKGSSTGDCAKGATGVSGVTTAESGRKGGEASIKSKSKNSNKDDINRKREAEQLSSDYDPDSGEVPFTKEKLSQQCSMDSDIFGFGSSSADSGTRSSDKKFATCESDDSLDTMWICPECSVAYVEGATDMVGCDACDNWFHWSCVGLLVAPPDDVPWYCQNCAKKKLKKKNSMKSSLSKKGKK